MISLYNTLDIKKVISNINNYEGDKINIMEICGTHTASIYRNGIEDLLPENINLISGPGCPVCVTPSNYIDLAIELSKDKDNIILTFGDLLKVRGSNESLYDIKSQGRNIKIVYSPLDAIDISIENKNKQIIFLAVGFETTIATYTCLIDQILKNKISNISLFTSLMTIPKTLEHLLNNSKVNIQGLLAPGHVATIIGIEKLEYLSKLYKVPSVVSGFKGEEILLSIDRLIKMIEEEDNRCFNLYKYCVREHGNKKALQSINKYFTEVDALFRGIGIIKGAGLCLRENYSELDTLKKFKLVLNEEKSSNCLCGEILMGIKKPNECKLFGKICNTSNPLGPCMVSAEGNCANYYRYKRNMQL